MRIDRNLSQIRAEVLLNYLYPEMEGDWIAQYKGTFFRNYNEDILALYEDENKVVLARDGFLRLLPEGLLTNDDDLKGEDVAQKFKELEWRKELLNEAFSPFDTYIFRKKLTIERNTSELLEQKLEYLLKEYFNFDLATETNELVKEAAVLLPFVSRWRGDFSFVANLFGALMNCEVEVSTSRYSHLDSTICWLPRVRFDLLIPGLTPEDYRKRTETMEPLVCFVREWLIPFDVWCEVRIKEHHPIQGTQKRVTLDYNTEVNNNR
jgi:hypothetical protein